MRTNAREILLSLLSHYPNAHSLWRVCEANLVRTVDFGHPLLDIGCGDGTFSSILFSKITVGLDADKVLLRRAKNLPTYGALVAADATFLPFKEASFSSVLSNCTIEHIPKCESVIKEIRRILSSEGIFVFTVPSAKYGKFLVKSRFLFRKNSRNEYIERHQMEKEHHNCFSIKKWRELLAMNGLHIFRVSYYLPPVGVFIYDFLNKFYNVPGLKAGKRVSIRGMINVLHRRTQKKVIPKLYSNLFICLINPCKVGGGLFIEARANTRPLRRTPHPKIGLNTKNDTSE